MRIHEEDMTSTTQFQEDVKEEAQSFRNLVGIRSIHGVDSEDDADDIQEHNISSIGLTQREKNCPDPLCPSRRWGRFIK